MTYRKKLIEVALPLEAINKESAREKSIRHGHPSTLHLWWARRPLAACRAVLFAQFVDDPDSDPAYRRADGSVDEDAAGLKRAQLFNLIEELVKWENSNNDRVINAARAEIARCVASGLIEEGKLQKETIIQGKDEGMPHPKGPLSGEFRTAWELIVYGHGDLDALSRRTTRLCPPEVVNHFLATYAPPVLDPFAGGGSIPLEAQRLGLRAYASDLNPVAVLINKALIEIPPKFANQPPVNPESQKKLKTARYRGAEGLAEDVRYYGKWMRDEAERRIGHLYPKVKITKEMAKDRPDLKDYVGKSLKTDATVKAWTVECPNPSCRIQVPLLQSSTLSRQRPQAYIKFTGVASDNRPQLVVSASRPRDTSGTKRGRGNNYQCPVCNTIINSEHVYERACSGVIRSLPLITICRGGRSLVFLPAETDQYELLAAADTPTFLEAEVSPNHRCYRYGFTEFAHLFSERQRSALMTFSDLLKEVRVSIAADAARAAPDSRQDYADAVITYLAFGIDKLADYGSRFATWMPRGTVRQTFARQRIAMSWDYVDASPFGSLNCAWDSHIDWICRAIDRLPTHVQSGSCRNADATDPGTYPVGGVVSTDPPYYNNIPYADCSDYFYVWMKHNLSPHYPELFGTILTPKEPELVADPRRFDGDSQAAEQHFLTGMRRAFGAANERGLREVPVSIYYAFKQAEDDGDDEDTSGPASTGWEVMLEGLIAAGLQVVGTWPMRTERGNRMVAIETNALASSIVLTCCSRPVDAAMATRREFLNALKHELPNAMKKLQSGNTAPVDLAQAAIGPGMAVFSRFSKVVESDGEAMTVRSALTLINQVLDEVLAEQEGEFDSDTRWAVSWFEQHGVQEGPYGVAETLSKAKNTSVQGLVDAGVVTARGGKVKLLARNEMPEDWDPITDTRSTCWEATQHLIRRLQHDGEQAAAELLSRLGGDYGERARDLAYRLYSICERKGWAQEALAYNSLVIAWSEIGKLALAGVRRQKTEDSTLFGEGEL